MALAFSVAMNSRIGAARLRTQAVRWVNGRPGRTRIGSAAEPGGSCADLVSLILGEWIEPAMRGFPSDCVAGGIYALTTEMPGWPTAPVRERARYIGRQGL